jgi:hypothetical protein
LCLILLVWSVFGFVFAPWLLGKSLIETVRETYGAELRLGAVEINPFVLSLTVDDIALDDPGGAPVAIIDRVFANFQLSSLFRWAFTFAELRIDVPEVFVERHPRGELNLDFLFAGTTGAPEPSDDAEAGGLPRVLIHDFAVTESVLNWLDRQPERPVESRFGPVNVEILELNTLPQRSGEQSVVITTESSGILSWTGDLQLNPLASAGRARIEGPHFALPSEYLQQLSGFSVSEGQSAIDFAYAVHVDDAGTLRATVEDFDLSFAEVTVRKNDPGTALAGGTDRQVLVLPELEITGASLRWPEQEVRVPAVVINDAEVGVYRDAQARINWLPDTAAEESGTAEPAGSSPWKIAVDHIEVNRLVFGLEDHSVEPAADIGLASLSLVVSDVSNADGARFPLAAEMQTRAGGTITIDGDVQALPSAQLDWRVVGEGVSLQLLQPYMKRLADVNLDSGDLGFSVELKSNDANPLWLAGDARISDFLITESDEGSKLGSWQLLDIPSLELNVGENSLAVSELVFQTAYADIFIAGDGTVNLGRIEKGELPAEAADAGTAAATDPEDGAAQAGDNGAGEETPQVRIGRVLFEDSGADFADESLPLPFSARIAELGGEISTIASDSREASSIALEGKVDEHGYVRVSGSVTPLDPALDTDMRVAFENVDMPKFSAYSVPFAGRKIASGRLDLDLGYRVEDRKLEGENGIVLRDFELGEKVDHPGAMSLPLGLAVALLKDPSGKIDIDLPVRGDLDDPEFKYGGLVLTALANLIVKIVASPFALLGNLIGVEADEISHVNFIAGRADLTPPERERVGKLVEALKLRPQLALELPGSYDPDVDGLALRQARVAARVEARLSTGGDAAGTEFAEARRAILEALYLESGAGDAAPGLDALRLDFTSAPPDADEDAGAQLDTLAYAAELERRLVDAETVGKAELAEIAAQRSATVLSAVLEIDPALEPRVFAGKPVSVENGEESAVPMEIVLTADAEARAAEETG